MKALQVEYGSEFATAFELACHHKQLPPFVLPPKSLKLNARVERSHHTHYKGSTKCTPTPISRPGSTTNCFTRNTQLGPSSSVPGLPHPTRIHHWLENDLPHLE